MYLSVNLTRPRWLRTLTKCFQCVMRGHHLNELMGTRELTGVYALMLGNSGYTVYRCQHCGHYSETLKPGLFSSGSRWVIPRVAAKEPTDDTHE